MFEYFPPVPALFAATQQKPDNLNRNLLLAVEEYRHGNDEGEQGEAVPDEIDRGRDDFRSALDRRLMNVAAKAVIRVVAPDSIVRAPPTRVFCNDKGNSSRYVESNDFINPLRSNVELPQRVTCNFSFRLLNVGF